MKESIRDELLAIERRLRKIADELIKPTHAPPSGADAVKEAGEWRCGYVFPAGELEGRMCWLPASHWYHASTEKSQSHPFQPAAPTSHDVHNEACGCLPMPATVTVNICNRGVVGCYAVHGGDTEHVFQRPPASAAAGEEKCGKCGHPSAHYLNGDMCSTRGCYCRHKPAPAPPKEEERAKFHTFSHLDGKGRWLVQWVQCFDDDCPVNEHAYFIRDTEVPLRYRLAVAEQKLERVLAIAIRPFKGAINSSELLRALDLEPKPRVDQAMPENVP